MVAAKMAASVQRISEIPFAFSAIVFHVSSVNGKTQQTRETPMLTFELYTVKLVRGTFCTIEQQVMICEVKAQNDKEAIAMVPYAKYAVLKI